MWVGSVEWLCRDAAGGARVNSRSAALLGARVNTMGTHRS